MNTVTDLRRTLDRHADAVVDPAAVARTTAVHHRVAVVRRRRRALAGGTVAAAVVVAGVVAVQLRSDPSPSPAGPVVLGQRAPATISSLGYVYDATGTSQVVHGRGTVAVARSSTPTLLSWTTDSPATVTFVLPDDEVHRTRVTAFHDFLQVPAGIAARVRVRVADDASVGIATYALGDTRPAGYTRAGVTYRATVAGAPLLGASVGDLGATSVTTSFVAPHGPVSIGAMCSRLPDGYAVNVDFGNGGPVSSTACDSDGSFDPGAASFTSFRAEHPGVATSVRIWISRSIQDTHVVPAGSIPGLRLGVGLYGPVRQQRIAGAEVPVEIESRGHTWRLASSYTTRHGVARVGPATQDQMASVVWHTRGHTVVDVAIGSQTPTGSSSPGGQGGLPDLWVPDGGTVRAHLAQGAGRLGVAVYERVD
jgi:hypothetical protein